MAGKPAETVQEFKPRPCDICRSPYRREIEKLVEAGEISIPTIARKYQRMLRMTINGAINKLRFHKRDNHKELVPNQVYGVRATSNGNIPSLDADKKRVERAMDFEIAAEQLLSIGMEGAENLSPKEALALAAQLQKTHLEGRKVRVSEDSLKLTAAKFFGGFLGGGKALTVEERNNGENPPLSLPAE